MRTPRRARTSAAPQPTAPPVRGRRAHAGPPADESGAPEDPPETAGHASPTRGGRRRLRPAAVRAKIVCLLMVPVMSLLALWAYATVSTAQDMVRLRQVQRAQTQVGTPVAEAVAALQAERTTAVRCAAAPTADRAEDLRNHATRTDRAVAALRLGDHNTVADGAGFPPAVASRLAAFVSDVRRLRNLRTAVLDRRSGWDNAYGQYTRTIESAFSAAGALTVVQDAGPGPDARVLLEFFRAAEQLAREDALMASARPAGTLDEQRLRLFIGAVQTRRTLTDGATADLRGPERAAWQRLAKSSAYTGVLGVEDEVSGAGTGRGAIPAATRSTWDRSRTTVRDGLRAIESTAVRSAADRADPFTREFLGAAGAAVLLGLVAVAASLFISVRIGRGLVVELTGLRDNALDIARRKLPHAIRRLRSGEAVDIDAEAPLGPPAEDEIGQVSEALDSVHRAALRAAIERAELAGGISAVFVNLARRSQVLVHRQLGLLDTMERRAEDPDELSDLFRLDHLTTRMRRHAESLIILSGAAPGRAWRIPVPLTSVVRAAVSEIEDYARVEVRHLPEAAVVGSAVADLTHLLAELVENAAQFSPPHTRVLIGGEPVGNGYALEVEDRGLGMGQEMLADANRRIEESEGLDLFDSDRLGLFVVSRLSARHGIKVHLRTSPYGGTTAVVLLPTSLLHGDATEPAGQRAATALPEVHESGHAHVPGIDPSATPATAGALHPPGASAAADHPHPPRPVLVAPLNATVQASDIPAEASLPPGVATLRGHRPPTEGGDDPPDRLPRRVRQANLAPQLRAQDPDGPATATESGGPDEDRTPESVRDRMTAYRDGWTRGGGRPPGRTSRPGTDDPARRTNGSEGESA
ncbi:nitrate- and nitrite sensing domain-containing protein [Streptomyces sp. NPDC002004]